MARLTSVNKSALPIVHYLPFCSIFPVLYYNFTSWIITIQLVFLCINNYLYNKNYSQSYACFFIKNDLMIAGTAYYLNNKKNNYLNNVLNKLKIDFDFEYYEQGIKKEGYWCYARNSTENFFFENKNILLIGEASGLLTSLGEGISSALFSKKIAAEVICKNNNLNNLIHEYETEILTEKKFVIDNMVLKAKDSIVIDFVDGDFVVVYKK